MRFEIHIWSLLIAGMLLVPAGCAAKKVGKPNPDPSLKEREGRTMSVEREQQFTYYWYAARQAITEERYPDAYALLRFCEMLNPDDASVHHSLGVIYSALKDDERALLEFSKAFALNPYDNWSRYSAMLFELRTEESQKASIAVLERALEVHRKAVKDKKAQTIDEDLLERLQLSYINNRQYDSALKMQDELDAIRGYNVYSAYFRMRTYILWGKYKLALKEVDRYLEEEPTDVQFMQYRVNLMEQLGAKPEEIYAVYDRLLALAPNNLMALNNYAYLLAIRGGDLKKAERMSEQTIREEPNNPVYLDTYGWILHLQGEDTLAVFYLRKALNNVKDAQTEQEVRRHLQLIVNSR